MVQVVHILICNLRLLVFELVWMQCSTFSIVMNPAHCRDMGFTTSIFRCNTRIRRSHKCRLLYSNSVHPTLSHNATITPNNHHSSTSAISSPSNVVPAIQISNVTLNSQDEGGNNDDEYIIPWFQPDLETEEAFQSIIDYAMDHNDPMFDDYCELVDDFGCEAYEENSVRVEEEEEHQPQSVSVPRWIRVEAKEDKTLRDIRTLHDVYTMIAQVQQHQSKFGPTAELYPREWIPVTTQNSATATSKEQKPDDNKSTFAVLQFNMLAEGLSSGPNVKTPFWVPDDQRDKHGYGGFTDIAAPNVALDFSLRRWRLLQVLLGGGIRDTTGTSNHYTAPFDILALEEVDRFRGFFAPVLRLFGYQGLFMPKMNAPGVRFGFYSDGCALFWKSQTFQLVHEQRRGYRVGGQVWILATLRHMATQQLIVVAVTHLKAKEGQSNECLRSKQMQELLDHIQSTVDDLHEQGDGMSIRVLLLGDFNTEPHQVGKGAMTAIQQILCHGRTGSDNSGNKAPTTQTIVSFESPCDLDTMTTNPPVYTTFKTRGERTSKRVIDYIFYASSHEPNSGNDRGGREGMACTHTLSIPAEDDLEPGKLPGLRYPSDHIMIAAKFTP